MPPALRKRPVSPASAAATHLTHHSSTDLLPATVAPQPSTDTRLKTAVSR
ncbi:hypothetical protein [Streptomyces sp. NPDC057623]